MKKLLALCLTVVLVLAMMPIIGASAAGQATFSVGNVTGAPGDEVTVPVSIDTNPGLTFAQVMIGYDASALEIVNIEKLTLAGKPASHGPLTANPIAVTWADGLADTTDTGVIANITFKIKDDAATGDYTLTVEGVQENTFNLAYEDVPFTTVNGTITVESNAVEPPVIDGLTFIVGNATGAAGEEVVVPVEIAGNPGITFAQVMIGYDAEALEIVNIEKLTLAGKPASHGPLTANPIAVTWADGLADTTENGVIANITFRIKDGASGTYTLTAEGVQENTFNLAYEDVPFTTINGTITVGASSCVHEWVEEIDDKYLVSAATCENKAIYNVSCSLCGVAGDIAFEAGELAAHTLVEVVEDKYLATDATCTAKATYYKNCSVCGEVSDETFESGDVAAHTWAEVVDDKYLASAATCTAKATYYKSCSVCEAAGTETFEAGEFAAHTPTKVVDDKYFATEATCENKATYYTSCSVCGEALDATFEAGELAEHAYGEWNVVKEATTTETGLKEKVCSVCGDIVSEEIPMLSTEECTHEWVEVVDDKYLASAATCTTKATYYKSCSLCETAGTETFEAGELAPHTAAQIVDDKYLATEATCENKATYYTSCSVCGEKLDATFEAGELAEHTYGEWNVTKEPTESETGLKEKECSVCGDKVTEEIPVLTPSISEVIFAAGEVVGAPGEEVTVEISINENPGITFAQVMVGYDADALEVIAITPVTFAGTDASFGPTTANPVKITWENNLENITETGVIATITFKIKDSAAAADYALTVSADPDFVLDTAVNNVPFTVVDGAIKVHNHNWVEVVEDKYFAAEATCTAKATYYKSCSVCDKASDVTFETGELLDHTAAQVVDGKYLATEATCIEKATYYTSCSVCGEQLDATFEAGEVNADNHAGEKTTHAAVESTCTVQGNAEYVTCNDCGAIVEGSDAKLPLAPHTWAEIVSDEYLVSAATCTAKAVYNKSCSACGVAGTETFEAGELLAHTWVEVVDDEYLVSAATCTAKAVYNKSCSACDAVSDETFEVGEVLAHTWAEVVDEKYLVSEATCEAKAVYNKSCSVCGEANDETFEAGELAAHVLEKNEAVDATCTATGSIENWTCSVCEKIFSDAEATEEITAEDTVVEKIDHNYGEWKVVTEATTVDKGSKEKVCSVCGDKVTEEIPVLEAPEKPEGDGTQTSPTTNDVNIFVVVSMIMALVAAAAVVLKKKA